MLTLSAQKELNSSEQKKPPYIFPHERLETSNDFDQKTVPNSNGTLDLQDIELKCRMCKKVFSDKIIYLKHQWAHKKMKGNPSDCLPCTEHDCSDIFWKSENLYSHKSKVHGIQRIFSCDSCPYSSKNKHLANLHHENKHSQLNLNSYICTNCGDGFRTKSALAYHMKKKYGVYDYKCEECNYKTFMKGNLNLHMETHGKKIFRFVCSECGRGFRHKCNLTIHMLQHSDEKNYKCNFCEKSFRMKATRTHHEKIHLNIRAYECHMCPKRFRGHNNHKVHVKRHYNQKDYVCSRCERGFIEPAGLRKHSCPKR